MTAAVESRYVADGFGSPASRSHARTDLYAKLIDHQAADDAGILAKGLLDAASPSLHSLVGMGADSPTVCEKEVRIEIATAHKSRVARSRPGQSPRPN
jgi:hypothetical protein